VLDPAGRIADAVEVPGIKRSRGRTLPLPEDVHLALAELYRESRPEPGDAVVFSERGCREGMSAASVSEWFSTLYRRLNLLGCSSHSGRRTAITRWARRIYDAGGSLEEVWALAGHADLLATMVYIAGEEPARRRVVEAG
jgi:integrase/recombinase XerD